MLKRQIGLSEFISLSLALVPELFRASGPAFFNGLQSIKEILPGTRLDATL
jgi:hypothetical protein